MDDEFDYQSRPEFAEFFARYKLGLAYTRICLVIGILFGFAVFQIFRIGFQVMDYLLIIVTSAIGYAALALSYPSPAQQFYPVKTSFIKWLFINLGKAILVLLLTYVLFYRGLWTFVPVIREYSTRVLVRGMIFTVLGSYGLIKLYEMKKLKDSLDE